MKLGDGPRTHARRYARNTVALCAVLMAMGGCGSSTPSDGGDAGSSSMTDGGGSSTTDGGGSSTTDGGGSSTTDGGGNSTTDGGGGGGGTASLRVLHLVPDGEAVDFCALGAGGASIGPILAGSGRAAGIAYRESTGYLSVPAGTYSIRIVAPGAPDCSTSLGGLADVPGIALADESAATLLVTGMLSPTGGAEPFQVVRLDDNRGPNLDATRLRFVHAVVDADNVDAGLGEGVMFAPVFSNVAFGQAGRVGADVYAELPPLSDLPMSMRATGGSSDLLVVNGLSFPAEAVTTIFAIGHVSGSPRPLQWLVCDDLSDAPAACRPLP